MADQPNQLEEEVVAIINICFGEQEAHDHASKEQETQPEEEATEGKRVIDVDLYHLPGGGVLLLPADGSNPLDIHAVESTPNGSPDRRKTVPLAPLPDDETEAEREPEAGVRSLPTRRKGKRASVLVPLVLFLILSAGAGSYLFVLPLTASATVTIIPTTKTLKTQTTFPIAAHPKGSQVQGRTLAPFSLMESKTVPATGHAHQDATRATGVITFYNADSNPYTIPAGVMFTAQNGATIITDTTVTIQAAIPPQFGIAIASAHVVQLGSTGNILAHAIDTRCCGSAFVTATNTSAFSGGQDERDYSIIQTSDIQNASTRLLDTLMPKVTAQLESQKHNGEQLVPPLCNPRTQESAEPGEATPDVTVSVTQTCRSMAYALDSLNHIATSTLSSMTNLTHYQQVGTVQVTINTSTYEKNTATLRVTLSGVWIYSFTQGMLTRLTTMIAGESQQQAKAILERVEGVAQVSIHVQRLDFKDLLPTNPQRITVQFFYIVS